MEPTETVDPKTAGIPFIQTVSQGGLNTG